MNLKNFLNLTLKILLIKIQEVFLLFHDNFNFLKNSLNLLSIKIMTEYHKKIYISQ